MALLPLPLPFAELEVGHHLYWQIGDLYLHGQVFLSSWILIGILLAVVLVGTRGMKRDPIGLQNLLEFLWNFIRDIGDWTRANDAMTLQNHLSYFSACRHAA